MEQKQLLKIEEELELREEELLSKEIEVNYDLGAQLRRWLSTAIKASPLSRFMVAAKMSELLGKEISKFQLDSWTAESKEGYHLPAEYLPAACAVLEDMTGLRILAAPLGVKVLENKDLLWLELGKAMRIEKQAHLRKKQLEKKLQGTKE
jgi:hypothetical protein